MTFLEQLAHHLLETRGPNLMDTTIIFPNMRAAYYLKQAFIQRFPEQGIILPHAVSFDQWVGNQTPETIISETEAILRLYRSFQAIRPTGEHISSFISLGQTIFHDWEELTRNEIPIAPVYTALERWESTGISFSDFLDEDQKRMLRHFWDQVKDQETGLGHRMLSLWKMMPALFQHFQHQLKEEGLCTQAMAYEKVAKEVAAGKLQPPGYLVFAGFGQLTKTEIRIMRNFLQVGKAETHWDFFPGFLAEAESEISRLVGRLRRIPEFQKDIENSLALHETLQTARFEMVQCQGLAGMAHWISQSVKNQAPEINQGLIVLDPHLTTTLIDHAEDIENQYNFSMGFALTSTPEYQCILGKLVSMETGRTWENQTAHLFPGPIWENIPIPSPASWIQSNEPVHFFQQLVDWVRTLEQNCPESPYFQEVWRQISKVMDQCGEWMKLIRQTETDILLLRQLFEMAASQCHLPLEGKADKGLQVMGLYESRLLDFETVILAPVQDNLLPGKPSQSQLPDNLRRAFGLETRSQMQEDVMYQAWRLSHRAQKVVLLFDGQAEEKPSRWLYQIQYGNQFLWSKNRQQFASLLPQPAFSPIPKNERIKARLELFLGTQGSLPVKSFSPSSLHSLLQCPLRFCFSHLLEWKMPESEPRFGMDMRDFGNWIHNSIQAVLEEVQSKNKGPFQPDFQVLSDRWLQCSAQIWDQIPNRVAQGSLGDFPIEAAVGHEMVKRFFAEISQWTDFEWLANEISFPKTPLEGESGSFLLEGRADIVVRRAGKIQIIDLKTGKIHQAKEFSFNPEKPEAMLTRARKHKDFFQMLVYEWLAWKNRHKAPFSGHTSASLFYLSNPQPAWVTPLESLDNETREQMVFPMVEQWISDAISPLSRPDEPFDRTDDIQFCTYCEYAPLCQRL